MRLLHLIRHAKSAWRDLDLTDHDRPLNSRGIHDAPRMGKALSQRLDVAPKVFVSSARRAIDTLDGLADGWPALAAEPSMTTAELYTFSANSLREWVIHCDDAFENIALIGHNPAMTEFANYLCSALELENLPTAGWLCFRFEETTWRAAVAESGRAVLHDRCQPSDIRVESCQ